MSWYEFVSHHGVYEVVNYSGHYEVYEVVNSLPEIGGCFIRVFYRYLILYTARHYSKIIVQQIP